ncbi:MAG TPA: carbon-nitrogen hydrolase family protein [Gaiellales bacterium]|jgi:predicted amidohydrolase|nr:carbon-nitrogen hydrolase family protein [Gaiellales bacterium]
MDRITAACVQFSASRDKGDNIARMATLVEEAAARGARLVLLPEKWNAIADGRELLAYAESLEDGGDTLDALSEWARNLQLDLICGSIAIADGDRVGNVSIAFSRDGERLAAYTKIHLFDVDVGGISYRESDGTAPGGELVMANMSGLPVGLSVCYDLRFPEMYRALEQAGALVLTVPAAFTLVTGMAHWEPLLRARAIENQAFVMAADQHGDPGGYGMPRFGHSMIIDPWGTVIAQAGPTGDGVIVAELDLAAQRATRSTLPALDHRRPDAYTVADAASGSLSHPR